MVDKYLDYYIARRGIKRGDVPNLLVNLWESYCRAYKLDVQDLEDYTLLQYKEFIAQLKDLGYKMKRVNDNTRHRMMVFLNKEITTPHKPKRKKLKPRVLRDEFDDKFKAHPSYPEYCPNCPLRTQWKHPTEQLVADADRWCQSTKGRKVDMKYPDNRVPLDVEQLDLLRSATSEEQD